jgi:hypothetical protein
MTTTQPRQCRVDDAAVVDPGPEHHFGPVHGMPLAMTYLLGFLATDDGTRRWLPLRGFFSDITRSFRPMEGPAGGNFTLAPEAATGYSGPVLSGLRGEQWGYWRPDGTPMITFEGTSFRWREAGFADLEGESVGPGCQWYVQHAEHSMVYTSRPYRVRGHMRGQAVTGVFCVDSAHMPIGKSFFPSPYIDGLQIGWFGYINELTDGTWESGSLITGFSGFHAAVAQQDGQQVAASGEVTFSYEIDDGDPAFPLRARLSTADEEFVWEADPQGRWPLMAHLEEGHRIRQGTMRRSGCTVPVRRSYAFIEGYVPRIEASR